MRCRFPPAILTALMGAALLVGPSCSGPNAPALTSIAVRLVYESPDPATLPPPTIDDAMCYHGAAPSNLQVTTSWGATGRFDLVAGRLYDLSLNPVPTNQDLWVAFIDITLCPTNQIWVTSGVTANNVPLTHTTMVAGRPVLTFRIDGAGQIVP
jgi:hypothetical protein